MKRLIQWTNNPRQMMHFHGILTIIWAMFIIANIIWNKESITWVALFSIYAIIVGHVIAYHTAQNNHATRKYEAQKIQNQ